MTLGMLGVLAGTGESFRINACFVLGVRLSALDGRREGVANLGCVTTNPPTLEERGSAGGPAVPSALRALCG